MSDTSARIAEASAAIEQLKANIASLRDKLSNGCMGDDMAAPPALPARMKAIRHQRTLQGHSKKVTAISWASDSQTLASVYQDGKLNVWDALAGSLVSTLALRSAWVMTVCLDSA